MAKVQTAVAVLVSFAMVYWKKANNWRNEGKYGNTNDLRNSLAERGWVQHYAVSVTDITDVEQKEALAERKERWEALKTATTPDAASERQVFERLYVDPKTNKLIVPTYSGNAGFRRASCYEAAMVQRFRDINIAEAEKIIDQIPVSPKHYDTEFDRIVDQQLENELQNVGNLKMDDLDKLRIAKRAFDLGMREVHLRRLYTATTGQKLYGTCQANGNWPELHIYDRLFLDPNDASQIPYKALRADVLVKMNNRFDADQKRSKGLPLTAKEVQLEPISVTEVTNYFRDLRVVGAGNAKKIMAKKDIEAGAKQNAVELFRVAFSAVDGAVSSPMLPYIDHAAALNLHKKLIDSGSGAVALVALQLAESHPTILSAVVSAIKDNRDVKTLLSSSVPVQPSKPAVNGPPSVSPAAQTAAAAK